MWSVQTNIYDSTSSKEGDQKQFEEIKTFDLAELCMMVIRYDMTVKYSYVMENLSHRIIISLFFKWILCYRFLAFLK